MPTKSPPPPGGGSLAMNSRKPDLRVVIPPSTKGMMPPLVRPAPPQGQAPSRVPSAVSLHVLSECSVLP